MMHVLCMCSVQCDVSTLLIAPLILMINMFICMVLLISVQCDVRYENTGDKSTMQINILIISISVSIRQMPYGLLQSVKQMALATHYT